MPLTQASRQIAINTPLGEDVLLLRSFQGEEAISKLFVFELDLVAEDPSIKYEDIVGQSVTVRITLADGSLRYWNGFVSRFVQAGRDSNVVVYQATMVPWLWFLDQTTDCRIFQNKTAPDIIKQIFQEYGYHDFVFRLYGNFEQRDYCVQYRESDFNFASRLMEEEGIFYFFEHENGKHTLVLGNDPLAHKECPNQPTARYEGTAGGWQDDDVILQWLQEREFRPGVFTATDYNFETPSTRLLASVSGKGKWEIYDFPGEYAKRADGDRLARIRLEEQQLPECVARGTSDCRAFGVGYKFKLTDHYRDDLNQECVLTALHHSARQNLGNTSDSSESSDPAYENGFACVPATTPIRPPRRTPVPVVQGCQTGIVVGPAGKEIFTDKYGRVKVQFHWDREGKKNENSSCWIRVSHPWAGKGYGSMAIPRIGQEVIVDFVEGDPDRPIITGRVYNAEQMPHTDLPAAMMVSGFKSNSTPGGGGYNEISMDDTKGKEMLKVHAQYDMSTTVEHDDTQTVETGDRTITVKAGKHTETIKGDTAITIQSGNHSLTVQTGTHTEDVKGSVTEKYHANQATTVNKEIVITSETAHIYVHTATSIQLHVGASKLWMASNGDISLDGVNVTISGSNMVTVKGQIVHSEATAEHQTKGAIVISDGASTNTVKGGMVMLNP